MHNCDQSDRPNVQLMASWLCSICDLPGQTSSWEQSPQQLLAAVLNCIGGAPPYQLPCQTSTHHLVALLELYMIHSMGKKLLTPYRTELYAQCDWGELMGLQLYVLAHCPRRSEYIPRMMAMDCQSQAALRRLVELAQENVESALQNKEIFTVIEQLEVENNFLRHQLKLTEGENDSLQERVEAVLEECRQLQEECDMHNKQKTDIIRQLSVNDFADYLELLRDIDADRKQQMAQAEQLEQLNRQIQKERDEFRVKIFDDSRVRAELVEELECLKALCRSLKLSSSVRSIDFDLELSECSLKDYRPRYSFNEKENRPPVCRTDRSMCMADLNTRDDSVMRLQHECDTARDHYETLREQFDDQQAELVERNTLNERLAKENRHLQRKLLKLQSLKEQLQHTFSRHRQERLF